MIGIRKPTESDMLALERLFLLTRQSTFTTRPKDAFKIGDYAKSTDEDNVWIAEDNDIIVGFVSVYSSENFIHNLFIHPGHQGKGIGRLLLQVAEKNLFSTMTTKIAMDNQQVCSFYKKHGWREISRHTNAEEPYVLYGKTKADMSVFFVKQIETSRLIIRPVQLGDEIQLNKAIVNSLDVLQKWMPWANDPSLETTRDFVQRGVFAWESGSIVDFPMVVIHKEDQKIIAASGYNDRSDITQGLYEIGYWCDVDYQGKGYVTEYANAITRYAFDALGAAKVVISMQVENEKSIGVAKRLNFINEGVKDRDPLDCVSDKAEENYIYAVNNADNLPDLKYSWTDIEGDLSVQKIISWAKSALKITDDKVFASSKAIVKTPWSNVLEINTGDEVVYLKQTPIDLFLEAEIIKLLCTNGIKTIPQIIADNKNEHCFLMTKCGDVSLRDYFDGKLQFDILKEAIVSYKKLQHSTINCIDELIAIGVPDWRLDKFSGLYNELIGNTEYLDANNVTIEQQKQLHQYKDRVKNLCDELGTFGIAETLNHSDFHDNNILYDRTNKTTAIIDLGETAINHPLFSLHACIEAVKNRYHLTEDSSEYKSLQQCAFDGFLDDKQKFDRTIEIITLLFPVYLLFAQKRFLDAIHMPFDANDPLSVKQHEKINKGFVWFIKNMEATNAK